MNSHIIQYMHFFILLLLGTSYGIPLNENIEADPRFANAINKTREDIKRWQTNTHIPGIVAGISINGEDVWVEPFGYSDIENNVSTRIDSVWRMASISKSLTTSLVGKLMEEGRIDLDKSINDYLSPNVFPVKKWNGTEVKITVKMVMTHRAGLKVTVSTMQDFGRPLVAYQNVTQTVIQFKDDPLRFEPGTKYEYSNYGWQIIGAIIEAVMNDTYENAINRWLKETVGLKSTFAERHELIIPHRARYYVWNDKSKHHENNAVTADLWAFEKWISSGGMLSTVPDLLKYGNVMLNSFNGGVNGTPGILKQSTLRALWSNEYENFNTTGSHHGAGWFITNLTQPLKCLQSTECQSKPIGSYIWHSGHISGVSSLLTIFPEHHFIIATLQNLDQVDMNDMALTIAQNFLV